VLTAAAPWLDLGLGLVLQPDASQREAARTEGWIALPTGTLSDLVPAP
jgi:hypothetical protein